jgi:hypothetical protein
MSELFWLLFGLFFVWLIVTLCGHFSWVVTASVLKSLFGDQNLGPAKRCPRCDRQSLVAGQCTFCRDVPHVSIGERFRDELLSTAQQLARMQRAL